MYQKIQQLEHKKADNMWESHEETARQAAEQSQVQQFKSELVKQQQEHATEMTALRAKEGALRSREGRALRLLKE